MTTTTAAAAISPADIKAAFAAAGFKVRVRNFPMKFRICPTGSTTFSDRDAVKAVAASLGLTDTRAQAGGLFNGSAEFIGYKPGQIVRVP